MTRILHPLAPSHAKDETNDVHDRARDVDHNGAKYEGERSHSPLIGVVRVERDIGSEEQPANADEKPNNTKAYGGYAEGFAGRSSKFRRRLHVGVGVAWHDTGVGRHRAWITRHTAGVGRHPRADRIGHRHR